MPCLSSFGLRLWRRKPSAPTAQGADSEERTARPFSGSTFAGSISHINDITDEKATEGRPAGRRSTSGKFSFFSTGPGKQERPRSRASERRDVDDEKQPRVAGQTVTVPGPYAINTSGMRQRTDDARKRTDTLDSLDSPISPDSPVDEKRRVAMSAEDDGTRQGDPNRDSKMKDQMVVGREETKEEIRLRKMAEARRKIVEDAEQERLNDLQFM